MNKNTIDENTKIQKETSPFIINKLKDKKCCIYFCCFFSKKRKNIYNVLLDEGIKVFSEKMDLLRIFNKVFEDEEKINDHKILEMTDECKQNLSKISSKININSYLK